MASRTTYRSNKLCKNIFSVDVIVIDKLVEYIRHHCLGKCVIGSNGRFTLSRSRRAFIILARIITVECMISVYNASVM